MQVGSGSHGEQTGNILIKIESILLKEKPDILLVQGDTNTVMAAALAGAKIGIKIGHIEAGLRSYDRQMPEEINRIVTDHISNYLFVPTKKQQQILLNEGISKNKINICGNTIVDAVYQNLELAQENTKCLSDLKIQPKQYFLLTLHRPSNVDDQKTFRDILKGLELIIKRFDLPIIFPAHPRTKNQINTFKLKIPKDKEKSNR